MGVPHKFADKAALDAATKGDVIQYCVEHGSDEFKEKYKIASSKGQKKCTKAIADEAYLELCGAFESADGGEEAAATAMEELKVEEEAPAEEAAADAPKLWVKKTKKKGDKSGKPPKKGATVRVNYTGKLDDAKGKQFDSSFNKKKNEHRPLEFKVGTGRVIQGWDEALLTMVPGETAHITIQPEAAYGKKGLDTIIPPDQTLWFEVELVGYTQK